jgi:flagellar protein FlbD
MPRAFAVLLLGERMVFMIEVTKINGVKVLVNPDLIELAEETPDTVVSFTTGRKLIIKESRQELKNLVISYRKDIFT